MNALTAFGAGSIMTKPIDMTRIDLRHRIADVLGNIAFCGLCFTVILSAFAYDGVEQWMRYAAGFLVCFFGGLRVIEGVLRGYLAVSGFRLLLPLIGILAIALIQLLPLASPDIGDTASLRTLSLDPVETRNFIVIFAYLLIFGESLLYYAKSEKRVATLVIIVIVIGTASAVFGLSRMAVLNELPRLGSESGGFAQFANRNHFAVLIEMTLGLVAALLIYLKMSAQLRLALWSTAVISAVSVIFSQSRGGIFATILIGISAIVLTATRRSDSSAPHERRRSVLKSKRWFAVFAAIVIFLAASILAIAFLGGEPLVTRFERLSNETDASAGQLGRVEIWKSTIELVETRPLVGAGFGAFQVAITGFDKSTGTFVLQQAHNEYLEVAANGGAFGLVLMAVFLVLLARCGAINLRAAADGLRRAAIIGACLGVASVLIHNFVDFGLRITVNALVFAILLVLISARPAVDKGRIVTSGGWAGALQAFSYLLIITVVCIFSAAIAISGFLSWRAAASGSISASELSVRVDPLNYAGLSTLADLYARVGNVDGAIESLRSAVNTRPNDHRLWRRLGSAYLAAGDFEGARSAYERSMRLAPNYFGPKWDLGRLLLRTGEFDLAFRYLGEAADGQPEYVPDLVEFAQLAYPGEGQIDRGILLSGLEARKKAAAFLIEHGIRSQMVDDLVTGPDLTDDEKQEFVWILIDRRNYRLAEKAWRSITKNQGRYPPGPGSLINGSFEDLVAAAPSGFGWAFNTNVANVRPYLTANGAFDGGISLEVEFSGDSDPAARLVSQFVIVEPKRSYRLDFVTRVVDQFISGGLPAIEIRDPANDKLLAMSTVTSEADKDWQQHSVRFTADAGVDTIVIVLRRSACPIAKCPAFGKLGLDGFRLESE